MFPHKTARHLADLTGFPLRTVEYWLSRSRMPSEAVAALLQSEHGLEFLDAVMTDARPQWWVSVRRVLAMDGRRRARKNLQEAIDARDEIEAAIMRATNALAVSDPDFARPHADAVRDMARVQNRAVVEASKTTVAQRRPPRA